MEEEGATSPGHHGRVFKARNEAVGKGVDQLGRKTRLRAHGRWGIARGSQDAEVDERAQRR
eukprot:336638-Pyramimonas_sp.AAC.1